jgi:hypothetical protein
MFRYIYALILFIIFSFSVLGQGTLRGKITDATGETLIGVSIVLKENHGYGTTTDLDGNYSLILKDSGAQVILISYVGFINIEETIYLPKNGVTIKNFVMKNAAHEMKEVEITGKVTKSRDNYVEAIKKNSSVTLDYVSSESIRKTGDANIAVAVARIPGISTYGDFYTVRGIGDRYIKTSINNSIIPTLDPFTNNIKLDMIPSSLVDNVIVAKTQSADLPGDWCGAYLSIQTKDYPETFTLQVETNLGYNTQSSFQDAISSQRSSTDWMGYDDGMRSRTHGNFILPNTYPNQYEEFAALGLQPFYSSIGVNEDNWRTGTATGETYFKLGLVQLGLLGAAQINDNAAVAQAKSDYLAGTYKADAYSILNQDVPAQSKTFANNWNTTTRNAPLNFSQSISIGNQVNLFKKKFGYLIGFRYANNMNYDPVSSEQRVRSDGGFEKMIEEQHSKETNGWSGLVNLAYKFNENNNVTFLFMPNISGMNKVKYGVDRRDISTHVWTNSQYYEQRQQLVYQVKYENYLPKSKIRTELNASYTDGQSTAPDFKNLQYYEDTVSNTFQIGGSIGDGIHRYYRYLNDNLFDSRLSFEIPLKTQTPGFEKKIKTGLGFLRNEKKSDQYDYELMFGPNSQLLLSNHDIDGFLNPSVFEIHPYTDAGGNTYNTIDAYYTSSITPADHTFGYTNIYSAYIMGDLNLTHKLKIAPGVRLEKAEIFTDVVEFDSLNYPRNDVRRNYANGLPLANPGELNTTELLPSINVVYKLRYDETTPVNLRINYSKSIARPSIRELSDVATFDYDLRKPVYGNSELKTVHIDNYDLRLEYYTKSDNNYSLSVFDKEFTDHIELVESSGFSWQNVDKSRVTGIELEAKNRITNKLDLAANLTLIHSETEYVRTRPEIEGAGIRVNIPLDTVKRAMYGQAPYVINVIATFHLDSIGFGITAAYNVQGDRLVISSAVKEIPDIYESPRHIIDLKVFQKIGKHFTVNVGCRDLLNTSANRIYKYPDGTRVNYDNYTWGTNYSFGILYKL